MKSTIELDRTPKTLPTSMNQSMLFSRIGLDPSELNKCRRTLQPSIIATKCSCRPKRLILYANIILICSFYSWSSKPNIDTLWSKLRINI